MQLKSISLINFQAHKDLEIGFAPGITTIKGATDAGKSAVLRALRWACLNDVAGTDFIQEGAKRVTVTLTVSSGAKRFEPFKIIRSKSKDGTANTYALDGKEFKAFGQGVPPDVAQVLALNEINFQGQFDSPFWFANTAGEVSRKLNSVIDLSIIDTTLANIGAEVRRAVERKSLCEERLREAKEQLETLAPQKDRVDEFKNVKVKQVALKIVTEDFNKLGELVWKLGVNKAKVLTEKAEDGAELLTAMLVAGRTERAAFSLNQLIVSTQLASKLAVAPPDFLPVRKAWSEWISISDEHGELAQLIEAAVKACWFVDSETKRRAEAETRFHAQIKGKRCPLCNQTIQLDNKA